jgi:hypothetical protein
MEWEDIKVNFEEVVFGNANQIYAGSDSDVGFCVRSVPSLDSDTK